MSKSSWLFLCLTLISAAFGLQASAQGGQITAYIASAVFAVLLVLTLIVGRRIKFDPVLR
ncbi:PA3371 family protein [Pseudomonas trivialis]|uniref:PA3371 family protein n=1 Tax=Pseudomonas trivialis TaxID=200450 RepID=UPI0030D1AA30